METPQDWINEERTKFLESLQGNIPELEKMERQLEGDLAALRELKGTEKEVDKAAREEVAVFPREAVQGVAGKFADLYTEYLESPWTFFAFNFLTCLGNLIADRITIESELEPEPRLYSINIGESADDRKSESIKKTIHFFEDTLEPGTFHVCHGVGSAEGLADKLEDCPCTILVFDELRTFVSKSSLDGAILLPCVNTLFEDNRFHNRTKGHSVEIENGRLSILAASTKDTFARMWSSAFLDIGFLNRLWLCRDHGERRFSIPLKIPEKSIYLLKKDLGAVLKRFPPQGKSRLPIEDEARELFQAWYLSLETSPYTKRLDGYGLRLMTLFSVNECSEEITADITSRVIKTLNWQLQVRRELSPIDADGAIAKLEESIRRILRCGPMGKRALQRAVNYSRAGLFAWNNATGNLTRAKELAYDSKKQIYRLLD